MDKAITTCRLPLSHRGAQLRANKGNLRPRYHVYAVDYYSRVGQGYPVFIRGPPLEHPLLERMIDPANK